MKGKDYFYCVEEFVEFEEFVILNSLKIMLCVYQKALH